MNYKETIDWLENIPTSFDSNYDNYELKLKSIISFLDFLGNPQNDLKFIHVGGTNGKGSTCHIISSILQEHDFDIGLFSSPHLYDFKERIKINSDYIDENFIIEFISSSKEHIVKNKLSFFEISFAISLKYFISKNVDYAVIEVGLGGRLDSTNIITPLVSVITNIGYDHKKFLGNSLAEIAKEKAGIFKTNVPVVIGESNYITSEIFNKYAKEIKTDIFYVNQNHNNHDTDLAGMFQNKNINTAISSLKKIDNLIIDNTKTLRGIKNVNQNTKLIGRWQIVKTNPTIIYDIAHNINSLKLIFEELNNIDGVVRIVFGTLDKIDQLDCLKIFPKKHKYYFCSPSVKRAMSLNKLEVYAKKLKLNFKSFISPNSAFQNSISESSKHDIIIVTGSTYLFSEIK
jgi:dihydrofolate synthase/folylpolyglutamate synthase